MTSTARKLGEEYEPVFADWLPLAHAQPTALSQARVQIHWAGQLLSAPTEAYVGDDGGMRWSHAGRMLVTPPLTPEGIRCGLRPHTMELLVLQGDDDGAGTTLEILALPGVRYHQAFDWLEDALRAVSEGVLDRSLDRHRHPLPPHPLAMGAPFGILDAEDHQQLSHWYADADLALGVVAAQHGVQGPVFEPAHAALRMAIPVDGRGDVEVGMSPGDAGVPEPHFYAVPEPCPSVRDLLVLSEGGQWRTAGWFGAILCASRLAHPTDGRQPRQVLVFLQTAIESCAALLGARVSPSAR